MEELRTTLRIFLLYGSYIVYHIWIFERVFGKRKSLKPLISFLIMKGLLINVMGNYFLLPLFQQESWWCIYFSTLLLCNALLIIPLNVYTFRGSVLKSSLLQVFAEINYNLVFAPMLQAFNILEGRSIRDVYAGVLLPLDFLMIFFFLGIIKQELFLLDPFFSIFRTADLKKKTFWWMMIIAFVTVSFHTSFQPMRNAGIYQGWTRWGVVVLAGCLTAVMLTVCVSYRRKEGQKAKFLRVQRALMRFHYEAVKQQIEKMEQEQKLIDQQMAQILKMDSQYISDEKIREYIKVLKDKYREIRAGVYCSDWRVDAILCHIDKICQTEHIRNEFSFQGYQRGEILEEDMAEILLRLLNFAVEQTLKNSKQSGERIRLSAGTAANYLVLKLESRNLGNMKKLKKSLGTFLLRYQGEIRQDKEGELWLRFQNQGCLRFH